MLAGLVGTLRDFELAEDVLQDAVVAALQNWQASGIPDNPAAWLRRTAQNKAIDQFRRRANFSAKMPEIERLETLAAQDRLQGHGEDEMTDTMVDDRLQMLFTCCHPALAQPARVALTLRTLGGLTTPEIARAYLVPETTMAQRLVRAKRKIKAANIPYRVPPPELWAERLPSVLSVIYLIFNEGYAASSGDSVTRSDLCQEAIRLARILVGLAPWEPEAAGLLSLMLLHDSRRIARSGDGGTLMTLEQQDRGQWNQDQIAEGTKLLVGALARDAIGPYQIQAAISAVHAGAATYEETDWAEICVWYDRLYAFEPSPVIRLNQAVAVSMTEGPEAGLEILDALAADGSLDGYQPYHAARADFYRRAGQAADAEGAYRCAIDLSDNAAERAFLEARLSDLS